MSTGIHCWHSFTSSMQMGEFEIQPLCVMLGYFNVESMLGIILFAVEKTCV